MVARRHPVRLRLHVTRDRRSGAATPTDSARRARAARAARPPAAPCLRDAACRTRDQDRRPGTRRARTSRRTSRCGSCARCPSSWAITTSSSRLVNGRSTSVSQSTTRRLGPRPDRLRVRHRRDAAHVLDDNGGVLDVLDLLEASRGCAQLRVLEPVRRRSRYGETNANSRARPMKTGAAGIHQRSPKKRAKPMTIASARQRNTNSPPRANQFSEDRRRSS